MCRVKKCKSEITNVLGLCSKHYRMYKYIKRSKLKPTLRNGVCPIFGCFIHTPGNHALCTCHNRQLEDAITKME